MDDDKLETLGVIEDAVTELSSYLKIANSFVFCHCYNKEVLHIGLILDKMNEHVEKLYELFTENKLDKLL